MSAAEPEVVQPELAPETPAKKKRGQPLAGTLVEVAAKDRLVEIEPRREGVDINTLMVHAVQTGNIDTMERVMAIRRELKAEAAREAFFAALSAFQAECPIIKRRKPVYDIDKVTKQKKGIRYHYAPLDDIVRIVGPKLTKYGLSYKTETRVETRDGVDWLLAECIVHHEFGHQEKSPPFDVPVMFSDFMNKQQSFASACTFAKRYAFLDALGILTGDDDNDARSFTPNEAREARATRQPVSQPRQTPTAQKAAAEKANGEPKRELVPAGPEDTAIDETIAKALWTAMQSATLGMGDFKKRFSKIERLGQIRKGDETVVMSWIANPIDN